MRVDLSRWPHPLKSGTPGVRVFNENLKTGFGVFGGSEGVVIRKIPRQTVLHTIY